VASGLVRLSRLTHGDGVGVAAADEVDAPEAASESESEPDSGVESESESGADSDDSSVGFAAAGGAVAAGAAAFAWADDDESDDESDDDDDDESDDDHPDDESDEDDKNESDDDHADDDDDDDDDDDEDEADDEPVDDDDEDDDDEDESDDDEADDDEDESDDDDDHDDESDDDDDEDDAESDDDDEHEAEGESDDDDDDAEDESDDEDAAAVAAPASPLRGPMTLAASAGITGLVSTTMAAPVLRATPAPAAEPEAAADDHAAEADEAADRSGDTSGDSHSDGDTAGDTETDTDAADEVEDDSAAEEEVPWWSRPEESLTRSSDVAPEPAAESMVDAGADDANADEASADEASADDASADDAEAQDAAPAAFGEFNDDTVIEVDGDDDPSPAQPDADPMEGEATRLDLFADEPQAAADDMDQSADEPARTELIETMPTWADAEPAEDLAEPEPAPFDSSRQMASQEESGREEKKPWWARAMGGLVGGGAASGAVSTAGEIAERAGGEPDAVRDAVEDRATEATDFFRAFGRDEETEVDLPAVETPDRDEPAGESPAMADVDPVSDGGGMADSEVQRPEDVPIFGAPGSPVARLIFSSGNTMDCAGPIVVGRSPHGSKVSGDAPTLVAVPSPNHEISGTHLDIRPGSGLDLGLAVATDLHSTNGTIVIHPGLSPRTLRPGVPEPLFPGSVVDLGDSLTIKVDSPTR
ncbi:MAG: hypothetical protein WAW88_00145, partial [Nocardioides sp.]